MPFRLKLRRTRRYNVLSKNYFVTRIRLLDSNVIECTLSVESTGQECLEAVAQRLELRETHYFGLWFQGKTQAPAHRWVELEKPLKKQLDKFGNEPLLFFGVMFYVPNVSRLEQEATRYQYYLQVKKEVLDGRLHCTVEQGIRLAGLAVQADFGDFTQFMSQDFLREYVLFPVVNEVLEEWTQKVAEEHKSHCRMQAAEAELLYIKEVEKLDGFGQESFPAKDNYTNDIFIGVSFIGVFVKHRNGRSIIWKDIGTIAHNKSAITVEITSRDDTIIFHMVSVVSAGGLSTHTHTLCFFFLQGFLWEGKQKKTHILRYPCSDTNTGPRPQSCNFQSMHSQYGEHYQDTQSSQDSIFHDDPYYKSETSLDRCQVDFPFRNGTVPNGSMYSSPSLSSLNHSQTFVPPSPMSSNLSIPGSELMRTDYIPSHRHSAIIAPSYRPTPEYDAVMRQKRRMLPAHHDLHSQSLRSLNISNSCAYRQPEALVYSQPEMRERAPPGPVAYQHQKTLSNTLERQKMSVDSMKRPLMMAALNGLYVARMPVSESPAEEGAKAATDERCKTLELKLEEERVFTEYEQVPKKRADCVLTTATLPENTERNRFRDVVPYEENRVELVPNKENNTGYINASHIKVMIRGEEWHYIATQGPLANTCADFWQMVWEQGVNVIAMVTAEEEGGRSKSHRYWPKLGSKHNSATHGKFKVTTKFRTDSGCYATTGLKVKHLLSGQERTVWHLQYTDWPEQGCPEYVQGFLAYLEEIQSVRRHTNSMLDTSKSLNPPVVVHCSAGVGRTGVVILTELMISCLEHNEQVEVPTMLSGLRQQRMLMVQTISQYKFVYQVLIQFLKNSRLI
uniref:Protein tyrosine phosphatase non-receptor type 14 n=1 Tax=Dicentrarchus labrax TaxID=13489 RepID=A0A8C4NIX1_DICLA